MDRVERLTNLLALLLETSRPLTLVEIAGEMGDQVSIVKLNIDENPETARAYRVMSVPTLTVFKDGEPVQSIAGAKPKGELVRLIQSAL